MKQATNPSLTTGLLAAMIALISTGHSAVIYRNNFGNNTAGAIALNNAAIDWSVLRSQDGADVIDVSSTGDARVGVNQGTGRPSDVGNVNAPTSLSNSNGIAYLSNGSGPGVTYSALFYTTHFSIDRSAYSLDSFQWYANQSNDGGTSQRLALQVGGAWYVTTTTVTPPNGSFGNFSTSATLQTVDFSTAQWYDLTAGVGSPFSIGSSTVALPGGDITGFGLYVDNGTIASNYSRFDTFTINGTAIPEPGTFALTALGALPFLRRRRRR